MTVCLSLGMLGGLLVGGQAFARAADSEQRGGRRGAREEVAPAPAPPGPLTGAAQLGTKNMIAFFYCLSIAMCYALSFLAMPLVRRALRLPALVLVLQALATLGLGFGVAVQYYHIPALVGATFGRDRGLYTAYTDGVAALVSSAAWRLVGGAVEEGNPQGGGWAYGWAALALLLVVCGTLMVKILELYFVRGGWRRGAEDGDDAREGGRRDGTVALPLLKPVGSWMEESLGSAASPLREPGSLKVLSASALEYLGTPPRGAGDGRKRLARIESGQEFSDAATPIAGPHVDLLGGIDDNGSLLLLPSTPDTAAPTQQDIWAQDNGFVSFDTVLESPAEKVIQDKDSSFIRESSVFDDPYSDSSFEL